MGMLGSGPRRQPSRVALCCAAALLLLAVGASAQDASPGSRASAPIVGAAPGAPVDIELESALTGRATRLSTLRSRVVVLFYEDREHIPQNEDLKGTLQRFIADNHLEPQLMLLPVANADGYAYAPVDAIVRSGLAEGARRMGMDILIDWDRRLHASPFSLRGGASNVVVIDRSGRILFRHVGRVEEAQRTELFRAIRQALRTPA